MKIARSTSMEKQERPVKYLEIRPVVAISQKEFIKK